jgi:hypothetical protein
MSQMKKIYFWCASLTVAFALRLFADAPAVASPGGEACPALRDAVILIVRHAEKPESGFELSPAGTRRAAAYATYFKSFTDGSRVLKPDYLFATADSEGSHRPRLTLEPLGEALGLKLDSRFKNKNVVDLAREIRSKSHGKCILIAWHHGEIPELTRALGADAATLLPDGKWPPEVFNWVLLFHYDHEGRLESAKRINENLMPGDAKP